MSVTSCHSSRVQGLRHRGRGRRSLLTIAVMACLGLVVSACAASGNSASASSSSSGPDLSYFHGKTITMIVPDNPGGSFDEWSRLIAPAMGKYLGATINVENIPAGNTVVGQNTMASSQPNGLTIGWLNAIEDVSFAITGGASAGVNFDPADMSMIGAPGQNNIVWVTDPSSSYSSWQSIVNSKQTVDTLDVTSGTADLYLRSVYGAYGVDAKYITGYESSKLLAAGFLRHDGPVAEEEFTVFSDAITANEARPVLDSNTASPSDPGTKSLLNVPSIAQIAQTDPPKTSAGKAALQEVVALTKLPGNILAAPKGVPSNELAALQAAAKYAFTNASVSKRAEGEGLSPGYFSGPASESGYKAAQANINVLKPYMSS
jgi:tripartite-type tricarboxylate transporter receptor subunit TctC